MYNQKSILLTMIGLLLCVSLFAQDLQLEQIKATLISNPPGTNPILRENTILSLDSILTNTEVSESQEVENFYASMMDKVNTEYRDTVISGAVIWQMYNHGFLIKTPQITMAFDLIDGVFGYWSTLLSSELISSIDVLFVTHSHLDHYDHSIRSDIIANGGTVIVPSEIFVSGDVPMAAGDSLSLSGLKIKAHFGLHSVPSRLYEVITPDGLKFLHTGDNQTSTTLPDVSDLDVLLLNAWVNESGTASAVIGMRNCLDKLEPSLMIPAHIQELYHAPDNRARYAWVYEVDEIPIPSDVMVMAWGEKYHFSFANVGIMPPYTDRSSQEMFLIDQNYPNPFNPRTAISYSISAAPNSIGAMDRQLPVNLSVFNMSGKKVATLVNDFKSAGYHTVNWDASQYSSGIYIYRLQAGDFVETKKMILLK